MIYKTLVNKNLNICKNFKLILLNNSKILITLNEYPINYFSQVNKINNIFVKEKKFLKKFLI